MLNFYFRDLAKDCPNPVDPLNMDSPHVKTCLLLQAHFARLPLPCADYLTDLKSVLDQAIRILQVSSVLWSSDIILLFVEGSFVTYNIYVSQAMIDVCAENAWLATTLRAQQLMQQIIQGRWAHGSPILTLPLIEPQHMYRFVNLDDRALSTLPGLREACFNNYERLASILRGDFDDGDIEQVVYQCTFISIAVYCKVSV